MLMFLLFLAGSFLTGFGIMIAAIYWMKDGVAWKVLTAGDSDPLVFSQTRDGENLKVEKIDDASGGLWSTDDVDYMTTEEAAVNMGGIPVMFSTENSGVGIPIRFAAYTQWLKQQKDVHDVDELEERVVEEAINQKALKHEKLTEIKDKGLEDIDLTKRSWEDINFDDIDLEELDVGVDDVDFSELEGFDMQIPVGNRDPQPSVRLQDFRRFTKQNLNPALIRAKIAKRVAEIREKYQGFQLDSSTGFSLFLVLMGIGIVLYIVLGGGM